jgi:hypothetical protein
MVAVELLVAGLIVVLVALLARLASVMSRRSDRKGESISEAQARQNAAPLTTAILASDRRERTRR